MCSVLLQDNIDLPSKYPVIDFKLLPILEQWWLISLLSSGASGKIKIWDLETGDDTNSSIMQPLVSIPRKKAHEYMVTHVLWYPFDNGMFLSCSYDHTVKVWDTNALQSVIEFPCGSRVNTIDMSFVASHCLVAVASDDIIVKLCDLNSGAKTHSLIGHRREVTCVKWSPVHEHQLATGSADGTVKLWDIRRARIPLLNLSLQQYPLLNSEEVQHTHTSSGVRIKRQRVSKDEYKSIQVQQHEEVLRPHDDTWIGGAQYRAVGVSFTADGTYLAGLIQNKCICLWDVLGEKGKSVDVTYECETLQRRGRRKICPIMLPQAHPFGMINSQPSLLVPCGREIVLYDLFSGAVLLRLGGFIGACEALAWRAHTLKGTEELYSSTDEGELLCWETHNGVEKHDDDDDDGKARGKELFEDAWSSSEEE